MHIYSDLSASCMHSKYTKIEFYPCTCPLWTARSTAGMARAACPFLERAPLMAVMEDLSKEKQRLQRNQAITLLSGYVGKGSHTTGGTEHQWSKGAVFYLSDSVE